MAHDRPTISTHVLDTAAGRPRAGVRVSLRRLDARAGEPGAADAAGSDEARVAPLVGEGITDGDGRIRDLLGGTALETGRYRLEFDLDADGFFEAVALDLRVADTGRSYHVPLLLAPFGLTTYRGS